MGTVCDKPPFDGPPRIPAVRRYHCHRAPQISGRPVGWAALDSAHPAPIRWQSAAEGRRRPASRADRFVLFDLPIDGCIATRESVFDGFRELSDVLVKRHRHFIAQLIWR